MQEKLYSGRVFKNTLGFLALAVILLIIPLSSVHAQTTSDPQFLMTWHASNSYVPPSYIGQALPNSNSLITASLEIIANGHVVNISNQTIYWYLDDGFLGGGIGAQQVIFHPHGAAPNTMILKVELPDYPTGLLIHEISVPLVAPEAVIDAPFPNGNFSRIPLTLQALPYFFNASSVDELNFSWSVNGQTVTSADNPQTLQVSLPSTTPSGYNFDTSLAIQDVNDESTANALTTLTYQPQP
jgi:hypothetical protein